MITIENDNACSLSFLAKKWNNMDFIEKEIISLELDNCLSINDFNFYHNNKIIFYYDFDNDSFSVKFKEKMYIYNKIIIISFINESNLHYNYSVKKNKKKEEKYYEH